MKTRHRSVTAAILSVALVPSSVVAQSVETTVPFGESNMRSMADQPVIDRQHEAVWATDSFEGSSTTDRVQRVVSDSARHPTVITVSPRTPLLPRLSTLVSEARVRNVSNLDSIAQPGPSGTGGKRWGMVGIISGIAIAGFGTYLLATPQSCGRVEAAFAGELQCGRRRTTGYSALAVGALVTGLGILIFRGD